MLPKSTSINDKGIYDAGWDELRRKRLQGLQELGIIKKDIAPLPPLVFEKAWEKLSNEERAKTARDMEVYAAMVDYMDEQIKRIFDYLKEIGKYDNTLVVFFSDNGANGSLHSYYPGQTEEYLKSFDNSLENRGPPNSYIDMGIGWAQASMTPSRMFKRFTSEGGIRSPMLVKLPGKMANAATMNHSFFHVRDIMPTILDITGVEHPEEINGRKVKSIEGRSVLDLFEGKAAAPYAGASQVGYELFGMRAFFDGNWKILRMPEPYGTGEWQLYNLEQDPAEQDDLGKQNPDKLKKMIALWEQYRKDNGVLDIDVAPLSLK
jgi:arylsulfatase